ncbi:MAG: polysaccharide deacetylase family protein [Planctomycetia bacterium]|jgi:peptidoglycan/xylan/chitin deacetylase (PgdA/CDA1 family)|uniref:polysaccharide deacetylase family protein n=1 Tax=Candidatus Kuenenia sp. TaxID=2499824 RepID=UPI001D734380|nr:polysaccharide deacetylase family protein [Planctomycetia bacterium]
MKSVWLMYHDVYREEPLQGIPRSASMYHVSEKIFKQHLSVIIASGRKVITITEFLKGNFEDSVVLTFDDGWRGSFEIAMPLLQKFGLKATFFITKDFVGRKGFCDRENILRAVSAGMEIGLHGTTHRMLASCSREEILWEFYTCKQFLESLLGQKIDSASLPGGDLNRIIIACTKEAGLKSLCASRPGINKIGTSLFNLKRVAIRESTSASEVQRYCNYNINKELIRWALFQVPYLLMGKKNYAYLRRWLLGERRGEGDILFKP